MGKLWNWFRDSQRSRPRGRSLTRTFIPTARDLTSFRPGRATKVPQVFHAVPTDTYGTWGLDDESGQGVTIHATYDDLVSRLGQPNGTPSNNSTSEWALLHDGGRFSIYDYKATSEYNEDLPSVGEFRKKPYDWHVGTDGSQEAALQ